MNNETDMKTIEISDISYKRLERLVDQGSGFTSPDQLISKLLELVDILESRAFADKH